jgi:hypothetical protein
VIIAHENDKAISCGAIKSISTITEVKRMYALPENRAKIATKV